MSKVVLDSSALVAFIRQEPGADRVGEVIHRAVISTVSLTEVLSLSMVVAELTRATAALHHLPLEVVEFLYEDAFTAAALGVVTQHPGLTLADRCCLALGHRLSAPVLTADKSWSDLDVGVTIELIR